MKEIRELLKEGADFGHTIEEMIIDIIEDAVLSNPVVMHRQRKRTRRDSVSEAVSL